MSQIVVPAAAKSVITPVAQTTFQVGSYTALTDAFTKVVDLNDHVSFWLVKAAMAQPTKVYARTSTIRAAGERITAWNYKNRHITLTIQLLYQSGTTALLAAIRALLSAIENPPYRLAFAPPNAGVLTYADVVAVSHTIPTDAKLVLAKAINNITIDFECAPGFSGDRITMSNLVVNPGFEAPSGPGQQVFFDTFGNFNAYTASGGALTQDVTTFSDVLLAFNPIRYYRMDERAGTTAYDATGNQNGTITGGVTLGATGALNGSSDTAMTFNGSTGYISLPTTGLPTGNSPFTLMGRFKTSVTGAFQFITGLGGNATKTAALLYINNTNKLVGDLFGSSITSTATYTDGLWHHAAFTWDGTTGTLYADGAQVATSGTLGPNNISYGAATIGAQFTTVYTNFFNGTLDECAIFAGSLTPVWVNQIYSAGLNAPVAAANTMKLAAGVTATFGSPAWGAINQWQLRFRFNDSLSAFFKLHATDASNFLSIELTSGSIFLNQTVGGVGHPLGTATFNEIDERWYWLRITQFPSAPGTQCGVQATVYYDSNGAVGAQVAAVGPVATFDGVTALSGHMALTASGAALGIGGSSVGVHAVNLFGPGGWTFVQADGTTGVASGAWEQTSANTYPGGAATSYGAARIDAAPAGTLGGYWQTYTGGAPQGTSAIPAAPNQTFGVSAWVQSSGVGASCAQTLQVKEYDAAGAFLRSGTVATKTGAQASWAQLSGTYTTGASCAYIALRLEALDSTTGSAGGTVWFDNTQCWNQTTTGQSSMPYCELRFPQSPAQLLLTGLQGDMVAPAALNLGIYMTSWSTSGALSVMIGQRAYPHAAGKLLYGAQNEPGLPQICVLDTTVWGGYYQLSQGSNANTTDAPISVVEAALVGRFHLLLMVKPFDNHYSLQTIQSAINEILEADFNGVNYAQYTGAAQALGAAASMWLRADAGAVPIPFAPSLEREDLSTKWLMLQTNVSVSTFPSSATSFAHGALTLLPVDGGLISVTLGNLTSYENGKWLYVYNDPPQMASSSTAPDLTGGAWRFSLEASPLGNPAHAVGGPGLNGLISIQSQADPALYLDPTNTAGANGGGPISQLVLTVADTVNGFTYANATDVQYTPLYLYPRGQ